MYVPANRMRLFGRKFAANILRRRIRGAPKAQGFVRELPWLKYFVPVNQRLALVRILPFDGETLIRNWIQLYEVYFVDENGSIMAHMPTSKRFENRPYDALMEIDESKRHVRFMVSVERNSTNGATIALFKFPKGKHGGPWAREILSNLGLTEEDTKKWKHAERKAQFVDGRKEAKKALED